MKSLLPSLVACSLALGACTSNNESVASSSTTDAPLATGQSSTTMGATSSLSTTSTVASSSTTEAQAESMSAEAAAAVIRESGDWEPIMDSYDPGLTLSAVEAVPPGAASAGALEQIFLFSNGSYLGTATAEPRIASSFEQAADDTITVTYGHYAPEDAFCCPSLEPWVVELRWNGTEIVTSGEFPPLDQGLG